MILTSIPCWIAHGAPYHILIILIWGLKQQPIRQLIGWSIYYKLYVYIYYIYILYVCVSTSDFTITAGQFFVMFPPMLSISKSCWLMSAQTEKPWLINWGGSSSNDNLPIKGYPAINKRTANRYLRYLPACVHRFGLLQIRHPSFVVPTVTIKKSLLLYKRLPHYLYPSGNPP